MAKKAARRRPFRGITFAKTCDASGTKMIKVQGIAPKLRNFNFPIESFFGDYADTDIPPVPVSDSQGGLLSDVKRVQCHDPATGTWCVLVPFSDYGESVTVGQQTLEYVNIVLWHYYQNKLGDLHIVVEQARFQIDQSDAATACTDCDCT